MSRYISSIEFSTEFEGDTVRMRLRPLRYGHFLGLLPILSGGGENVAPYVEALRGCVGDYVTDFAGLKDADGNALPFSVVLEDAHFLELLTKIGNRLLEVSSPANPTKPAG